MHCSMNATNNIMKSTHFRNLFIHRDAVHIPTDSMRRHTRQTPLMFGLLKFRCTHVPMCARFTCKWLSAHVLRNWGVFFIAFFLSLSLSLIFSIHSIFCCSINTSSIIAFVNRIRIMGTAMAYQFINFICDLLIYVIFHVAHDFVYRRRHLMEDCNTLRSDCLLWEKWVSDNNAMTTWILWKLKWKKKQLIINRIPGHSAIWMDNKNKF